MPNRVGVSDWHTCTILTPPCQSERSREKAEETFLYLGEANVTTSRLDNDPIDLLQEALIATSYGTLPRRKRLRFLNEMRSFLVRALEGYHTSAPLSFDFDPTKPAQIVIGEILREAQKRNQSGPVAQHLVGAKLAIRFPNIEISNFPYSAPDDQAGRAGDFCVGSTAFHVTVAPKVGHIQRCAQNLKEGLSACLLVSDVKLAAARALLENENLHAQVAAESVESFVGQNLSELSEFAAANFADRLADLLTEYNRRVASVETDEALLIEIPKALRRPRA